MLRTITTVLVISGGILFTGMVNVRLPDEWFNAIMEIISFLYQFDGLFPVDVFFNGVWVTCTVIFYFYLFKYIIGFASLVLGTGKPEIE